MSKREWFQARLDALLDQFIWVIVLALAGLVVTTTLWFLAIPWEWRAAIFGAFSAFLFVAVGTASIVAIKHWRKRLTRMEATEKGLFDYEEDCSAASKVALAAWAGITGETERRNPLLTKWAKQMTGAVGTGNESKIGRRVCAAQARDTRKTVKVLAKTITQLERGTDDFLVASAGILRWRRASSHTEGLTGFLTSIQTFHGSVAENQDSTKALRAAVHEMPKMTRDLNAANADLVGCLDRIIAVNDRTLMACQKMLNP